MTTKQNFCLHSLLVSWHDTETILKKMFEKMQQSEARFRAGYRLYEYFSEEKEITPTGLAKAFAKESGGVYNSRQAFQFFFELDDSEMLQLRKHFLQYHSPENRMILPGFYTVPLKKFFDEHFQEQQQKVCYC